MSETTIEKITCSCGAVFEWKDSAFETFGWEVFKPEMCATCQEIHDEARHIEYARLKAIEDAEKLAVGRRQTEDMLNSQAPARFRTTDTEHPSFNRELWERVKRWRPTADIPWLGLVGESGTCKTRIAYLLLWDIVMESIRPVESWCGAFRPMSFYTATAYELSEAVRSQYTRTESGDSREHLESMRNAGILLLDDFGKAKHTTAVSAEIFAILDHRHAENLPMIWTANSQPDALVGDMTPDMAGPLAGRLIECSTIVTA